MTTPRPSDPSAQANPGGTGAMPWVLIAASCFAMFATTASGSTRAPFLIDMARDLDVGLPMVANLFGLTSIAWGISSFIAGAGSDRWGRRPFLIGGPVALCVALALVANAEGYAAVALWATIAGGCSGLFTGVSLTEVSARVTDGQRSRALGWVMAGQSLTLLVGVPAAAWLGASIGWRGVNVAVGLLALISALGMYATTRVAAGGSGAPTSPPPPLRAALSPMVLRLLGSVIAERICFGVAAVYFATFLQTTFGLSLQVLALPLAVFAVGNILGTVFGGQLGDRLPNRLATFAVAMIVSGIVAMALFGWYPSLTVSVVLGFAYAFTNALSRPSLMAALANVPAEVRGTVMGLNSTCASIGWLGAAAIGGWILATVGFAGFGPLIAVLALSGAALAALGPRLAAVTH